MKLEEKLVQLRKEKGLSQMYVAEALEVSRQAISRWEVGSALPSTENLRKLAELYGVSVDALLNDQMVLSHASQKFERQPLAEKEEPEPQITSVAKSKNRAIYIVVIAALVLLGIVIGYLIGQHRAQEAASAVIPIEELEVETWDDLGADMYTYGWPDVWEGGEEE